MKLIIAIVQRKDAGDLTDMLNEEGFRVTKIASTGGFLKSGNTTLLIVVEESEVDKVIDKIKDKCKKRGKPVTATYSSAESTGLYDPYFTETEVEVGGATMFVIDVDKFMKI